MGMMQRNKDIKDAGHFKKKMCLELQPRIRLLIFLYVSNDNMTVRVHYLYPVQYFALEVRTGHVKFIISVKHCM